MANFRKIASQLSAGVKREFLSPNKVRLNLSWGFPHEAFDGQAKVKPWHIISLVESGRALSFNQIPHSQDQTFLSVDRLYTQHGLFMGSAKLEVAKALYDTDLPKTPLTLEKELIYVGKSSMNIKTDVILAPLGLKLASCEVQSILVDRNSRKPVPFPDWWMKTYGCYSLSENQLKIIAEKEPVKAHASQVPQDEGISSESGPFKSGVSSVDMVVAASDTDVYGHVNWSVFLKYCIDAVSFVAFRNKSDFMMKRAVKRAKISYKNEGTLGQKIQVRFWTSPSMPDCMHFNIVSSGNNAQLLSYASVDFYDLTDESAGRSSRL